MDGRVIHEHLVAHSTNTWSRFSRALGRALYRTDSLPIAFPIAGRRRVWITRPATSPGCCRARTAARAAPGCRRWTRTPQSRTPPYGLPGAPGAGVAPDPLDALQRAARRQRGYCPHRPAPAARIGYQTAQEGARAGWSGGHAQRIDARRLGCAHRAGRHPAPARRIGPTRALSPPLSALAALAMDGTHAGRGC